MRIEQGRKVQIRTACPQDVQASQWLPLSDWLDPLERLRFRREDDRRAYLLAPALRRLAVARALAVPAWRVSFSSLPGGQPVLAAPRHQSLYFSHAPSTAQAMALQAPPGCATTLVLAPPGCATTLVLAQAGGAPTRDAGQMGVSCHTPVFDRDFASPRGRCRQPCQPERSRAPTPAAFRRDLRQASLPPTPFARA